MKSFCTWVHAGLEQERCRGRQCPPRWAPPKSYPGPFYPLKTRIFLVKYRYHKSWKWISPTSTRFWCLCLHCRRQQLCHDQHTRLQLSVLLFLQLAKLWLHWIIFCEIGYYTKYTDLRSLTHTLLHVPFELKIGLVLAKAGRLSLFIMKSFVRRSGDIFFLPVNMNQLPY